MDPMDYTMDDDQASHDPPNTAHRHQCQPSQSSSTNSFPPHHRENQHYDPVYDSSGWYQTNNTNVGSRPPYTAEHFQHWGVNSIMMPVTGWTRDDGIARVHGNQVQDSGTFRQSRFMGVPWNEMRGFEHSPFGYNSYTAPLQGSNGSSESTSAQVSAAPATGSHMPSSYEQEAHLRSVQQALQVYGQTRTNRFNNAEPTTRRPADAAERRPNQPTFLAEQRISYSRATRQSHVPRTNVSDPPNVRRRSATRMWGDSDDDDDSVPDMDAEAYRRSADFLLHSDTDDERSMAAVRGALASGKRVPSKEAIASLEMVKLEDLDDNGRTCIICYNEFGISNPEGITESPLRLPKCKHVFGDKCIKKWFEDSDSCPYCRDKLPSELSIRKTLAYETFRAVRREQLLARQRAANQGFAAPRHPFPEDSSASTSRLASFSMPRSQEDYELAMARNYDSWGYAPSTRSAGDSPESRRRQARGRIGNSRAAHMLGRPTSVGSASARWVNPASSHGNNPQRAHATSIPAANASFGSAPRRSVTPGLPNSPFSPSNSHTPRNRAPPGPSSSPPSAEASPPVAVGSGLVRDRAERQGEQSLRHSLDIFTAPPEVEWGSDRQDPMSIHQDSDHFHLGLSNRSRPQSNDLSAGNSSQALLDGNHPLGQYPTSEVVIDGNRHQHGEPDRNNHIDDLVANTQSRWSR